MSLHLPLHGRSLAQYTDICHL